MAGSSLRLKRKSLGLQMASLKMSTFCLNKSGGGYCPVTFRLHRGNCLCSRVLPCILAQSSDLRKLLCAPCPVCKLGIAALSDPKSSYKGKVPCGHHTSRDQGKAALALLVSSNLSLLASTSSTNFSLSFYSLLHPIYHPPTPAFLVSFTSLPHFKSIHSSTHLYM